MYCPPRLIRVYLSSVGSLVSSASVNSLEGEHTHYLRDNSFFNVNLEHSILASSYHELMGAFCHEAHALQILKIVIPIPVSAIICMPPCHSQHTSNAIWQDPFDSPCARYELKQRGCLSHGTGSVEPVQRVLCMRCIAEALHRRKT
jgi:hypothetical protein